MTNILIYIISLLFIVPNLLVLFVDWGMKKLIKKHV